MQKMSKNNYVFILYSSSPSHKQYQNPQFPDGWCTCLSLSISFSFSFSCFSLPSSNGVSWSFSVYFSSRELPRREPRKRYPGSMVTIWKREAHSAGHEYGRLSIIRSTSSKTSHTWYRFSEQAQSRIHLGEVLGEVFKVFQTFSYRLKTLFWLEK